jgi:hypothetical protein
MLMVFSKALRTSIGAACTDSTSCSNWVSDRSSTDRASNTWVASSSVIVANTSGLRATSVACSGVITGGKVEVVTGRVDVDVDSGMDGSVVVGTDVLDIVVVVEGTAVDVVV